MPLLSHLTILTLPEPNETYEYLWSFPSRSTANPVTNASFEETPMGRLTVSHVAFTTFREKEILLSNIIFCYRGTHAPVV